ncbi:MAG: hypothetical protein OCD02_21865 [Spirochaetaceae bacterium]
MSEYLFEQLSVNHQVEVIRIFNFYIKESTDAYRAEVAEIAK